ncbi:hypothetical protein [Microbulbifer hydrolyticus]|uniref:Uncharacterized protein n=1 Tax=Microbulbifer hydrolyticus TaxID=48074 RepID=A0A6P1TAJ6_9GAMM|nr:hypothetical protein [Microbulbifer hydrolyticus]MBB5213179.1 hypothetical protein [Microbulbifer hydrolyticus]QHQ38620.1 hypothetical protein GTQ55_06200 [Microbulbifer hydrolyticus]
MHRSDMRRFLLASGVFFLSQLCFADMDFKIALVRDSIFLNGVETTLESIERKLEAPSSRIYLYFEDGDEVAYVSVILYATENDHEIYLSENKDFSAVFPLEGEKIEGAK